VTAHVGQARQKRQSAAVIAAALAAGAIGICAQSARAQVLPTQRPAVQPQPQSPQAAARKAVSDAETALLQSKQAQQTVVQGVQKWFDQKPEFIDAEAKVKKAQADYDAAVRPVKQTVESSQEYQDLVAQKSDAQKTLDSASDPNATVSDADVSKAADIVVKSRLAMINMESDALSNDAKVAETREALKEAKDELAALEQQVTDALATNPDYINCEKDVELKESALQQAENSLEQQEHPNRPPTPRAQPPRTGG
jgi:hypothetical protein